jgi:hypothetical protein
MEMGGLGSIYMDTHSLEGEFNVKRFCSIAVLALAVLVGGSVRAADSDKKAKDLSFGSLKTASSAEAKDLTANWLKSVGKTDEATTKAFDTIWADEEAPVLDKVAASLSLGSEDAAKLLAEARNPKTSAPTEVPGIIKDTKVHPFLRANLALAYAKALSDRRIYEESRESLRAVKVEQVVDPAQYLFLEAVAEHALIMKREAAETIGRLLEDVADSPERYVTVAALMIIDMELWKEKDLGWIERKMGNIERRLDLARGGKKTQEIERQVVARLDELIKEKENQQGGGGGGGGNGGNCPGGGDSNGTPGSVIKPSSPQKDSNGGNGTGPGQIDAKKWKELSADWGKLPPKERASALAELTRDMPPSFREAIETYFKKLGESEQQK